MVRNDQEDSVYYDERMKPLVLTMGEPSGIGPDIILQLWADQPNLFLPEKIIIVGNKEVLRERAKILDINYDCNALSMIDVPLSEPCIPGQLNKNNAQFVIDMLTLAAEHCLQQKYTGIITAPIHKGILNEAGFLISGHTDFFSKYAKCKTVMMLMTHSLRVALLTDHIPLRAVANQVTEKNLSDCLDIIIRDFKDKLKIAYPKIVVCGLNPHAGENGYLGSEEQNIMIPVLEKFRKNGHVIIGPMGADVVFTEKYYTQADVILAMYHDQGLPVIKYSGFSDAINVTLGLPFIRTSVDHGTALDLAGTGKADVTSLHNAILFAQNMLK